MHDAIVHERAHGASSTWSDLDGPGGGGSFVRVAVIARGGMGFVELCWCGGGTDGRWVARKRLHPQFRGDPQHRAMFLDEARLARLVRHRNVVAASEVGEDADGPYLIMDYVEGISLLRLMRQAARTHRPIPMQVGIRICLQVALGLHAAHEACAEDGSPLNLVHRDVSPQNVLIGFDGSVRVTDFGIAKALGNENQTVTGVLKGNMGYLAPEQLRFEEPDRRSDLFSLGVTLFELLSGARLYPNRFGFEGTRRILSEPPPDIRGVRPDVPPALARLLRDMLSKRTSGRPSTALEVAVRLDDVLLDLERMESPLTVARYVDGSLATERERHRTIVAQHLQRAQRRALATFAAGGRRGGRRWVIGLCLVVLAAAAGLAGPRLWDRVVPRAAPSAPVAVRAAPPRPIEVVPLPSPADNPVLGPEWQPQAAPAVSRPTRHRSTAKKHRHGRRA
jgi:eukaryotic-like serine/threonine-protein kinase